MHNHRRARALPLGPLFDPFNVAQITDELRAEAVAKTAEIVGKLEGIRRKLELPPEALELISETYASVLTTLAGKAAAAAAEKEAAEQPADSVEGVWQNIVGSMPPGGGVNLMPPMPHVHHGHGHVGRTPYGGGFPPRSVLSSMPEPGPASRDMMPVNSETSLCGKCAAEIPHDGMRHGTAAQPLKIKQGQRVRVIARPQRLAFRPDHIAIENAERWLVHDIKIGNRSQFSQAGDIPGEMFSGKPNEGPLFTMETIQTAMDFIIDVTYVGDEREGEQFRAVVSGIAAI